MFNYLVENWREKGRRFKIYISTINNTLLENKYNLCRIKKCEN